MKKCSRFKTNKIWDGKEYFMNDEKTNSLVLCLIVIEKKIKIQVK